MSFEISTVIVCIICGSYLLYGAAIAINSIMAEELWSSQEVYILKTALGNSGAALLFVLMLVIGIPVYAVLWPLMIRRGTK